jgi:hypothetical protein
MRSDFIFDITQAVQKRGSVSTPDDDLSQQEEQLVYYLSLAVLVTS